MEAREIENMPTKSQLEQKLQQANNDLAYAHLKVNRATAVLRAFSETDQVSDDIEPDGVIAYAIEQLREAYLVLNHGRADEPERQTRLYEAIEQSWRDGVEFRHWSERSI